MFIGNLRVDTNVNSACEELVLLDCSLSLLDLTLVIADVQPGRIRVELISERSCVVVVSFSGVGVNDFHGFLRLCLL